MTASLLGPVSTLRPYRKPSEVKYDFTRSIPEGFTLTRETAAFYIDNKGYPRIAGPHEPLFERNGLVLDPAITNYLNRSEWDSSAVAWNLDATGLAVDSTYKFGDITMARIVGVEGSSSRRVRSVTLPSPIPITAGVPVTVSVFTRAHDNAPTAHRLIMLPTGVYEDSTAIGWRCHFFPKASSADSNATSFTDDLPVERHIDYFPDGVMRHQTTITPAMNGTITSVNINWSATGSVSAWTSDGNTGLDLGGMQISLGRRPAYVRSDHAATTRASEILEGSIGGDAGLLASSFALDFDFAGWASSWPRLVQLRQTPTDNAALFVESNANNSFKWRTGSYNPNSVTVPEGRVVMAYRRERDNSRGSVIGTLFSRATSIAVTTPIKWAIFAPGGNYRRYWLRSFRTYTELWSDSDLQTLTVV